MSAPFIRIGDATVRADLVESWRETNALLIVRAGGAEYASSSESGAEFHARLMEALGGDAERRIKPRGDRPAVWVDPGRMAGQPCILGTRLTTRSIAALHRDGADVLGIYPELTRAQVRVALWFEETYKPRGADGANADRQRPASP